MNQVQDVLSDDKAIERLLLEIRADGHIVVGGTNIRWETELGRRRQIHDGE
jgi:hypothetical protein